MKYRDQLIWEYGDENIRTAFRRYFTELELLVPDWDAFFDKMTAEAANCYARVDEKGSVIGFIQFSKLRMTSWFFEDEYGFVQEFWVAPEHRGQGHGSRLLELAEEWFDFMGVTRMILTTYTAEGFYQHRGYRREKGLMARNLAPVYVKHLEQEEEG